MSQLDEASFDDSRSGVVVSPSPSPRRPPDERDSLGLVVVESGTESDALSSCTPVLSPLQRREPAPFPSVRLPLSPVSNAVLATRELATLKGRSAQWVQLQERRNRVYLERTFWLNQPGSPVRGCVLTCRRCGGSDLYGLLVCLDVNWPADQEPIPGWWNNHPHQWQAWCNNNACPAEMICPLPVLWVPTPPKSLEENPWHV
jgi:hypothetical protein